MICFNSSDLRDISIYYNELGQKKLLKKSLISLSINKKVYLYYSKNRNIPICTLPKLKLILSSKQGFLSFCYNFFAFANMYDCCIPVSPSSIKSISKFVMSHEVGHILDPDIYNSKEEYTIILTRLIDKLIEYDIDIKNNDLIKGSLPYEIEECVLDLKRNLISRETKAWDIAKSFLDFENNGEEYIFSKIKEYALATYNFGDLKNIIKEHNLDTYFKYRKYF
ncbi:hypothetical protein [Romboutsia sp.]|uniref:hypothetical protein n=1 Tax=Romboutsia sp. TaxID=1965302 RepID=UPI003F30CB98